MPKATPESLWDLKWRTRAAIFSCIASALFILGWVWQSGAQHVTAEWVRKQAASVIADSLARHRGADHGAP